jgi:hypothetical protein
MANTTNRKTHLGNTPLLAFAVLIAFAALPAVATESVLNTIRGIRSTDSSVEIELQSTKPFPVRSEIAVLRIGTREFMNSRYPADGRLDTLIFKLTPDEFAQVASGDPIRVQYGRGAKANYWDFGTLDKRSLAQ